MAAIGLAALSLTPGVEAQGFRVSGDVRAVAGGDTVALPGAWVVLHRITFEGGTAVDSVRTDGVGHYAFRDAEGDTAAAYTVSVRHAGVAYFGEAVGPPAPAAFEAPPLLVFDTSSTAPTIELAERRVAVLRPDADGSRRIVEVLRLVNRGDRTRVSGDGGSPTWRGGVSPEPREFETGPGSVSGEAVGYDGGAIEVYAPIPPGSRDLLVAYLVPAGTRDLPLTVDQPTGRFTLLLEDGEASLAVGDFADAGVQDVSGLTFRLYEASDVAAGTPVAITLHGVNGPSNGRQAVWILVPLVIGAMGAVLVMWWRRVGALVPSAPDAAEALAARIAALDREYAGREDERYVTRRAELKAELASLLARRESGR